MPATIITPKDLVKLKKEPLIEIKTLLDEQKLNTEPPKPEKQCIKSHQVQRMLAISPGTLQNLRINGTIPYSKLGGVLLYDKNEIERIFETNMRNKPFEY